MYTRTYLGGDRFEEQTLVKDLDVTDIHCYDFDKDGDVDILLTFDYLYSSSFSFLLLPRTRVAGILPFTSIPLLPNGRSVLVSMWTMMALWNFWPVSRDCIMVVKNSRDQ